MNKRIDSYVFYANSSIKAAMGDRKSSYISKTLTPGNKENVLATDLYSNIVTLNNDRSYSRKF